MEAKLKDQNGIYNLVNPKNIKLVDEHYINHCCQLSLHSAFQPIYSIPHRRVVGYESLLRARNNYGQAISPLAAFESAHCAVERLELDRACRWLHAHNFSQQSSDGHWLFLNLDVQSLVEGRLSLSFMNELFQSSGLTPHQIVVEILEHQVSDTIYLKEIINDLRKMGCLIAMDDFGAGHSNFDRVFVFQPDIVKIDRELIRTAAQSSKAERVLAGIVSLVHEAGSLVIIEGVETETELDVAIATNADMVQGFFFSRPSQTLLVDADLTEKIEAAVQQQQSRRRRRRGLLDGEFAGFRINFEQAIAELESGKLYELSVTKLFDEPSVLRSYLLDENGFQINSECSPNNVNSLDERFKPLKSNVQSNWSYREYFYHAMEKPHSIHISRPYLSVTEARMCVTVSKAVTINGANYVICCDIDSPGENTPTSL
jgi:EAL domain-containing protein (putative c-di-GMP-specific phosphodiesterase class I)